VTTTADRGQRYEVRCCDEAVPSRQRLIIGRSNDLTVAEDIATVARAKLGTDRVWIADRQWAQPLA
jgi:hypothetical protein